MDFLLKRKNRFLVLTALVCAFIMLLSGGMIYAKTFVEVTNEFETGIVDIELEEYTKKSGKEEKWADNPTILPGDKISKIPRISNAGVDCYVRAKITFRDADGVGIEDIIGLGEKWFKADDGYYYYKDILPTGKSVDIFQGLIIPKDLSQDLQEKKFYIDIDTDAIQSKNFEPAFDTASPWGSVEILECEKEGQYDINTFKKADSELFKIVYEGDKKELLKNRDDFFVNFPYLMPGDRYSDSVEIKNDGKEDIKLYFRSEAKDDSELLDKILLKITVTIDGKTTEFYSGSLRAAELSEDTILGIVPAGKTGTFKFEIYVPEELNNKYTILDSYVKWIFSTEPIANVADGTPTPDEDKKPESNKTPEPSKTPKPDNAGVVKTGDAAPVLMFVCLASASVLGIIIVILVIRKRREDE